MRKTDGHGRVWLGLLAVVVSCHLACAAVGAGRTYVVAQRDPASSDSGDGTAERPFRTISKAAALAGPGDTVLVYSGIYRERVTPARGGTESAPVTYQAAPGETVYVRGSEVWQPEWHVIDEGEAIREGALDPSLFGDFNPFLTTISINSADRNEAARPAAPGEYPETLGQLFVGGRLYYQAHDRAALTATDGSWLVNEAGNGILVNFRQEEALATGAVVEISVRNRIFCPYRRGLQYITVRGFVFEHCANQGPFPQGGAVSVRSGKHWVIEGNTIRYAKTVGLDCGSETWDGKHLNIPTAEEDKRVMIGGDHLIRNNVISDNGLCGIAGWNHHGTMIVGNVLERNNRLNFPHGHGWEEWAAIKLHASDALIAGNLIRDNDAAGVWIDNGFRNAHITRNVILNNQGSGVFLELGTCPANRVLISNNVIGYTRSGGGFYNGSGIYTHDASDIDIAHNLLMANAGFGVTMRCITPRTYDGQVPGASHNRILNNLLVGNNLGQINLPVESDLSRDNVSDYNVFVPGWRGKKAADFYVNQFHNPVDWDTATSELEAALGDAKVAEESWPDLKTWRRNRFLTFAAWQAFSGRDRHSIHMPPEGKSGFGLRSRRLELSFPAFPSLAAMECPVASGVTEDFHGHVIVAGPVMAGPFQQAAKADRVFPLQTRIENPHIKLTAKARAQQDQERVMASAEAEIPKPSADRATGKAYSIAKAEDDAGVWLTASQSRSDPELTSLYKDVKPVSGTRPELYMQAAKGVSSSASRVVLFRAPEAGWYGYDVAAELARRQWATAGFTRAELYVIDEALANAKLLDRFDLNTPDGYQGKTLKKGFQTKGETALKADWHLALRFQIVSPGPAPGGNGGLLITRFDVVCAAAADE